METIAELATRDSDGIAVRLLFNRETKRPFVEVNDSRTGVSFTVHIANEKALDAFNHPFAYAA